MNLLWKIGGQAIAFVLSWVCLKLGIVAAPADISSASGILEFAMVGVGGVAIEHYAPWLVAAIKARLGSNGNVSIALVLILPFTLIACTTATPRERYNLAAGVYDGAATGLTVYNLAKPLPAPVWNQVIADEQLAVTRLGEAGQWLVANPTLADLPGAPFPPLDPTTLAIDLLRQRLRALNGLNLAPLSPKPGGTTQPN